MAVTVYNWKDIASKQATEWKIISHRDTGKPSFLRVKGHPTEKKANIEPKPECNSMIYSLKPSYIIGDTTDTVSWQKVAHTTEKRVKQLTKFLKKKKVSVMAKGIVFNSHTFSVDQDSMSALFREKQSAKSGLRVEDSTWKTKDGFAVLSNAEVSEVYAQAYQYVAACFARENALIVSIVTALTNADYEAIDLDTGWPAQKTITEIEDV